MAIKIYFDASNTDGGSPWWASHKSYERVQDNLTVSSAEVEDDADSTDWETPCVQNDVKGYVLISGPHDYYDVLVNVAGIASDIGQLNGTGRATGGLNWRFNDYQGQALKKGIHAVGSVVGTAPQNTVNGSFIMRIQNNKKTLVCSCSVAGGIQIAPNPGTYYVSTKTVTTMSWSLMFLTAWSYVDIPNNGSTYTVPLPFGVGGNITTGPLSDAEMLRDNLNMLGGKFASLGSAQVASLQPMDESFQDPELKKQIGQAAQVMEDPEVKQKLAVALERHSKSARHLKG